MPIVQTGVTEFTDVTTVTLNLPSNITANNAVIATISFTDDPSSAITMTASGTTMLQSAGLNNEIIQIRHCLNATGGSTAVVASWTGNLSGKLSAIEYSDITALDAGNKTNNTTLGEFTLAQAAANASPNTFVVAAMVYRDTSADWRMHWTSKDYTILDFDNHGYCVHQVAYKELSTKEISQVTYITKVTSGFGATHAVIASFTTNTAIESHTALNFGGAGGTNTPPRYYTVPWPAMSGDWCIGVWVRPPAATADSIVLSLNDARFNNGFYISCNADNTVSFQYWTTTSSATYWNASNYPSTPNGTKDYLIILQSLNGTLGLYVYEKGNIWAQFVETTITGTINAGTVRVGDWTIDPGYSAVFPMGDVFLLPKGLTLLERQNMAMGQYPSRAQREAAIHLPFRSGETATETNLGRRGSASNATRVNSGFTTATSFFDVGPDSPGFKHIKTGPTFESPDYGDTTVLTNVRVYPNDTLIVFMSNWGNTPASPPTITCTDSASNSYTQLGVFHSQPDNLYAAAFKLDVTTEQNLTITITDSGSEHNGANYHIFRGLQTGAVQTVTALYNGIPSNDYSTDNILFASTTPTSQPALKLLFSWVQETENPNAGNNDIGIGPASVYNNATSNSSFASMQRITSTSTITPKQTKASGGGSFSSWGKVAIIISEQTVALNLTVGSFTQSKLSASESINNQYLIPSTLISAGSWTAQPSGTLVEALDETFNPNDTDYAQTIVPADVFEVRFTSGVAPLVSGKRRIKYRIKKGTGNGITVALYNNTTLIASWTHNPAPDNWTTYVQTLTGPQESSLTVYDNLRLRFTEV